MLLVNIKSIVRVGILSAFMVSLSGLAGQGDRILISGKANFFTDEGEPVETTYVVSAVDTENGPKGTMLQVFEYLDGTKVRIISNVDCMDVIGDTGYVAGNTIKADGTESVVNFEVNSSIIALKVNDEVSRISDLFVNPASAQERCDFVESLGGAQGFFLQDIVLVEGSSFLAENINGVVMLHDGDE